MDHHGMHLDQRSSLWFATGLLLVGSLRFATDTLHELDPDYWRVLEGTVLRYFVRAPSDGTWAGDLNAQWFKLLAVPCGMSLIYLRTRFGPGTVEDRTAEFRDIAVRGVWVFVWLAGFTFLELQKQYQFAGHRTHLVRGEVTGLNHLAHGVSAIVAWFMCGWLSFGDSSAGAISPMETNPGPTDEDLD